MATIKPRPVRFLIDQERENLSVRPGAFSISNERVLEMDTEIARLRGALQQVTDELGVPNKDYPAPAANAWDIAKGALNVGIEES